MRPRAVVTGAAIRVGRAVAIELAKDGFDLALHYRSRGADAEQTAETCREAGARVTLHQADLADAEATAAMAADVLADAPHVELLVNNASSFERIAFAETTNADWDRALAVNARAPFQLVRDLLPGLQRGRPATVGAPDGQHGLVVQLCDIGAEHPVRGYAAYSMSKAAAVMLVKAVAVELAPDVRAVGVSPGQVAWPEDYSPELRAKLSKRIPLGRAGHPQDVATLIRFLCREGHYLNGIILPVDGGLSVRYG